LPGWAVHDILERSKMGESMRDVEGKAAFITGGASGIGLGMAKAFTKAGMKAVIADLREEHIDEARTYFAGTSHHDDVHFVRLDVTDREAYARAADEAEGAFGKVHVLCNNAGIGISGELSKASYDDWDWGISVNLTGVFNGVHTFLPRIRAHGEGGHIVNTASMAGILQYSRASVYVTTKFAVVGLSEALAFELRNENIGVSAFCPGGVRTNIRDYEQTRPPKFTHTGFATPAGPPPGFKMTDEVREKFAKLTADPEEIGNLVLNGIRDNALYIFTAPEFRRGVEERFRAILAALGDDPERAALAREVMPQLIGSPIYLDSIERAKKAGSAT
jgi:NAD(P)-dependent dehydrogenase (short-subunit alcohol dehydrogenase family)